MKMPEIYEDVNRIRDHLFKTDQTVLYCTPQAAAYFIGHEKKEELKISDAVKIAKWGDELRVVPVKMTVDEETQRSEWREVGESFYKQLSSLEENE